jgi:hypothetical protein
MKLELEQDVKVKLTPGRPDSTGLSIHASFFPPSAREEDNDAKGPPVGLYGSLQIATCNMESIRQALA